MKTILLTNSDKVAIVDDDDYEHLQLSKWRLSGSGYAVSGKTTNSMHRLVNKTPVGGETDHINRNRLDNRRNNLRTCTHSENMLNRVKFCPTRGSVVFDNERKKWLATIQINKIRTYLGRFHTPEEGWEKVRLFMEAV